MQAGKDRARPRRWRRLALAAALGAATLGTALAPTAAQAYGRWEHGWHGGRMGWWWVDAGIWSWYANPWWYPYYGYPGYPYAPYPYAPPVSVAPGNLPPPMQSWYYCDAAQGYYPHVASCPGGWRAVPAVPPVDSAPRGSGQPQAPAPAPMPAPMAAPQS
jgi:hypothetical protein